MEGNNKRHEICKFYWKMYYFGWQKVEQQENRFI